MVTMAKGNKGGWRAVTLTQEAVAALDEIGKHMAGVLMGATVNVDGLVSALLVREADRLRVPVANVPEEKRRIPPV